MDDVLVVFLLLAYRNALLRGFVICTILQHLLDRGYFSEYEVVFERASIPGDDDELFGWIVCLLDFLSPKEADRVLTHLCPLFQSVKSRKKRIRILKDFRLAIKETTVIDGADVIKSIETAKDSQ